jgi:uncharacterized membrane protein
MQDSEGLIVYAAEYASTADAKDDFRAIQELHKEKFIGEYEAAVFAKDDGQVRILDTVASERGWGAKVGAISGAIIGILFPPSIPVGAAVGAGLGALVGNMQRAIKTEDVEAMGGMLGEGDAGIVVVAEPTFDEAARRLMKRAAKVVKQDIDMQAEELKRAVDEAALR